MSAAPWWRPTSAESPRGSFSCSGSGSRWMEPGATILICDDEPSLRELMRLSLEPGAGHRFVEADDGAAAIELIESVRPDLVLLDVMMPRVDGIAVLEHVRSH